MVPVHNVADATELHENGRTMRKEETLNLETSLMKQQNPTQQM